MNLKGKIPKNYIGIVEKITKIATDNNYVIYAVGGFVRDLIINREPNDLDIMVETDNGGIEFAQLLSNKLNLSEPVIFERFGTAKLTVENREIEFIMPRKEYYDENSRNPDTEIGSLRQDALRRDFTVNALFLRLNDMELVDLTGLGLEDIKNKIIRVTDESASDVIFEQDPLRILRAVRQSFQLDFEIESKTYSSMKKNIERIKIVSPERIRDEINKMLVLDNPSKAFDMLKSIGLFSVIFPELDYNVFEKTKKNLDEIPNELVLKLAILLYQVQDFEPVLIRLKYSKEIIKRVSLLIEGLQYVQLYKKQWTDYEIRKFEKKYRNITADLKNLCFSLGMKGTDGLFERIYVMSLDNNLVPEKDMFDGNELIQIFNKPSGKWISNVKSYIEQLQYNNPKITKDEIIKEIKLLLKNQSI
ncbi:HD domain-containing protein [Elusimicrobiota bacterium]